MAAARFLSPPACIRAGGSRAPMRPGVLDTELRVILSTAWDTRSRVYVHEVLSCVLLKLADPAPWKQLATTFCVAGFCLFFVFFFSSSPLLSQTRSVWSLDPHEA